MPTVRLEAASTQPFRREGRVPQSRGGRTQVQQVQLRVGEAIRVRGQHVAACTTRLEGPDPAAGLPSQQSRAHSVLSVNTVLEATLLSRPTGRAG